MQARNLCFLKHISLSREELDLSGHDLFITDMPAILAFLEANPEVKALNVSDCKFTDDMAIALAANQTLATVNLSDNLIGVKGIAALSVNQTFTSIDLSNNYGDALGKLILTETNPLIRANHAITAGLNEDVPSLERLCLFKIKHSPTVDSSKLTSVLQDKLNKAKV